MKYLFLLLSIFFNVSSYVLYKSIADMQHSIIRYLLFASGLFLGVVNVWFFTKSLKDIQLNVAYPVFSGACILGIAVISAIVFGEKISIYGALGAVFVILGITFLTI